MSATYILGAFVGVVAAYLLRIRLSGENLKNRYLLASMIFNLSFGVFHLRLVQTQCIAFYNCFPRLDIDHPEIIWTAVFCLFFHAFANPMPWTPKRWFKKRTKDVHL